jgi:uncharacterized protein DUF2786
MTDTDFAFENTGSAQDTELKIIMRIRALLKKAEGAATDAEREAYTAKAAEMSAKYGVEAASSSDDDMELKEYELEGNFVDMTGRLFYRVQEAVGCKAIVTHHGAGLTVIGYCPDVARGDILATCLGLAMNSGASKLAESGGTAHMVEGWMLGFIETAVERLRDTEQRARARGNAELQARRAAKVAETFAGEFPHTTRGSKGSYDMGAYFQGARAGRTADIGQARFGDSRRAIG